MPALRADHRSAPIPGRGFCFARRKDNILCCGGQGCPLYGCHCERSEAIFSSHSISIITPSFTSPKNPMSFWGRPGGGCSIRVSTLTVFAAPVLSFPAKRDIFPFCVKISPRFARRKDNILWCGGQGCPLYGSIIVARPSLGAVFITALSPAGGPAAPARS